MKPKIILEIEELYGIELKPNKDNSNILSFSEKNSYILNESGEIYFLNLVDNELKDVSFLKNIKSLSILILNNNSIENFEFLKYLKRLKYLYLGENNIKNFDFLIDLQQIEYLVLFGNNIKNIDFLAHLKNLKQLYLSNNNISDISVLKELSSLEKINFRDNKINDITVLKKLPYLKFIDISNNKIKDISPLKEIIKSGVSIGEERFRINDEGIYLSNNPLQNPSYEIIEEGNGAVLRFFDRVEKEGQDKIYEAKVTFVGEGRAGKTSLINRLLDSKSQLPSEDKRTRGIFIKDWEFKKQTNVKHIAHIWDFGGQDVYYPVHRFFLTENSVFVLLASSRQNTHDFDYWIPTIFQFGGKSPIILGQTCHDGNSRHWNDIGVYLANDNFNIIKDQCQNYHEINLPKNNKGLVGIKKSIVNQILKLPHYKKNVPKSWIQVRDLLNDLKKNNCISYLDLKKQMQDLNPESFLTKDDFEDCVKFFHSIGILLWYHKEPNLRSWVILNPKWAVDAVYKIIDYKKQTSKGIILSKDFDSVWDAKMYEDKHFILKEMLEVFKIAFPKKSNKADYIMPTRLESILSDKIWSENETCLSVVYNFEFMPKGMVNQISAELSRYISSDDQVWNNAVNFRDGETSSQVFENFYERKIIIKAKGNDARGIIKLIINAIENIIDGYKGVKSNILIPCICKICKKNSIPEMYSYDLLLNKIKENRESITCLISDEILNINSLLFNIGLPNPDEIIEEKRKQIEIQKKDISQELENNSLKVFVTYSWTDENGKFDENHQNKVGKFVTQLRTKWEIDAEFDLHQSEVNFIKMMYTNLYKSNKIIIVLSHGYAFKANQFKSSGVEVEYTAIINDIKENPSKYILVCFDDRDKTKIPFGFQGNDIIVIKGDLIQNEDDLPIEQIRLVSKLRNEPIVEKPKLGGKLPMVKKKKFD